MIAFLSGLVTGYALSQTLIIMGALKRLHRLRKASLQTAKILNKRNA